MTTDHNPMAFPGGSHDFSDTERPPFYTGMTLRDYFAAAALPGLLSESQFDEREIAITAYILADAMLAERNEKESQKCES